MSPDYELAVERYAEFDPEIMANPYPLYQQLRDQAPVHWSPGFDSWLITRYSDVVSGARDPRLSSARMPTFVSQLPESVQEEVLPLVRVFSAFLGFSDPPAHTRLRGMVNKAFRPRVAEGMRPRIQAIVDELLDSVQDSERFDLIGDFAFPLPAIVITEVVGVPPEDRSRFKPWSDNMIAFAGNTFVPDRAVVAQRSLVEMRDYVNDIVAQRRLDPKDDLISSLIAIEDEGDVLNEDEMLALIVNFLVAGHETTTNLIGNGMLALLRHPDQMQKLRDNPSLIETAVEELLRYDSPLQRTNRVSTEELEIGGKLIGKGQFVLLMADAANRDPAQFPDPDRLDITRQNNRHGSFGYGIHFCVGAPLVRVEGQIAIDSILHRLPQLRLESDAALEYEKNLAFRALKSLPLTFQRSAAA